MPAPSPVFPSASTAPRCQIALSAVIPASTTLRLGLPLTDTTSPTPHEECSSDSEYMPFSASHLRSASCLACQLRSSFVIVLNPSFIRWVRVTALFFVLSSRGWARFSGFVPNIWAKARFRYKSAVQNGRLVPNSTPPRPTARRSGNPASPPRNRARRGSPRPQDWPRVRCHPRQKPHPSLSAP